MKHFFLRISRILPHAWKQRAKPWNPNQFLSKQFGIHAEVFHLPVRDDYMMLSSGVNHLSAPTIWKETMQKEIEEDFLYQRYTSMDGFQTANYAVKLYERFLFSRGNISLKANLEVCMTIGASQAASLAVAYLHSIGKKRMLLVGMTYPLYMTLGNEYGYQMRESRSALPNRDMPTVSELKVDIEQFKPDVLVFTYPCNPSGEKYQDEELDQIMQTLYQKGIYCIFDCVCNMILSEKDVTVPEPMIMENKMMRKSIIVNSFSKTESVPGFRIGYIAGHYDVIQFVRSKQVSIMNPPNMPTIAVWITMLFRCLHLSEQYGQAERVRERIILCFKRMFFVTTVLCPQPIWDYVTELVDERLFDEYKKYREEMYAKETVFASNKEYFSKKLSPYLTASTEMDGGFNYLVKLKPCSKLGELEFCKDLLQKTGIAIFTESGFALTKAKENDYWVRISLAAPSDIFEKTIDRLYLYLSELEKHFNS
ncbi:pyridoxal phosphate-dependent aminotransferase [Anoxybacterium hadale]|uniref:Pyridoxal phosphate-dependent aminotransferase n=1 Tax=Anoxybacterium hadale TaxID=3408580 RepID=A0ACD1AEN0_9FIRM|nr:pyridoxal phosphate-dependent aminotransferase [Clostridiales bacterium]